MKESKTCLKCKTRGQSVTEDNRVLLAEASEVNEMDMNLVSQRSGQTHNS
jgi:hypothetical protein